MMGGKQESLRALPDYNKIIEDPKYNKALDIFMLLNKNNDGYIHYEETDVLSDAILVLPNKEDRGKIESKDKFKEIFNSLNLYNVDPRHFMNLLDEMQINTEKVHDALYEQEYKDCFSSVFCKCLKCCCRCIRQRMVKSKAKEFDQDQKIKKRKFTDLFTIIKLFQATILEGIDTATDIILLEQIYWEGMKPENADSHGFKIASLYIFISICTPFIIAYSSIVNMLLYNGVYEPA
jgi:hypothetical protein